MVIWVKNQENRHSGFDRNGIIVEKTDLLRAYRSKKMPGRNAGHCKILNIILMISICYSLRPAVN
jgi:hypothetical protein